MKLKLATVLGSLTILCALTTISAPFEVASSGQSGDIARSYGRLRTIAGSGAGGTDNVNYWKASFEGGYATNAALSRPHHAIADTAGNIFIVDKNSHSILKVTPDARIHTFAGTHVGGFNGDGPASARSLELNQPNGLYINGAGVIFVLDTGNARVRSIDSNGVMSTLFSVAGGINTGRGLWVNDSASEAVFCSGTDIKIWTRTNGIKVLNSKFTDLGNIILDTADSVIATDRGDNTVWTVLIHGSAAGTRTLLYGDGHKKPFSDGASALTGSLYGVRGVWKLPAGGDLLISDEGCQMIYVDTAGIGHVWLDGQIGAHSGDGAWFLTPGYKMAQGRAVSVDGHGNILVIENDNGYVRKIEIMPVQGASAESTVFTPGNLAVLRVGDGTETLAKTGNSLFVDQYQPNGTFANSVTVPDAGQSALLLSGTASSEGGLTRSMDRTALILTGYNTNLGYINSGNVPRAIASVDAFGKYNVVQASPDLYSGNNIRCGAGDGTNHFWTAGANGGTYFLNPPNPPVAIQSAIANTRYVKVISGNLYFSTQSGTPGIYTMQGLPQGGGANANLVFGTGSKSQPAAFDINSSQTLAYVADQAHGIQRWACHAGVWGLEYTLAIKAGAYGVVADFSGPSPLVYATTGEASANQLVCFIDTGSSATPRTLVAAGKNQWFRGLDFVPDLQPLIVNQPSNLVVAPGSVATFTVAASSPFPLNYQWRKNGVNIPGATNSSYTINSALSGQAGNYSVVVANPYTSLTSSNANLSFLETVPPKVTVMVPKAGLLVSNSILNVLGAASDNVAVAAVSYRLANGSWTVARGTTNWAGQVTLSPGVNWIQAFATDMSGNNSATISNKVTYIPCARLNVATDGLGTVSGTVIAKTNSSVLFAIGHPVTLTATPGKLQFFKGWSGWTNASASTLTFSMPGEDLNLTAQFAPSPIYSVAGIYRGLILPSSPSDNDDRGAFLINVSSNGTFSAKLVFPTQPIAASGKLGLSGQDNIATAGILFKLGGRNLDAIFQFTPGAPNMISGTLSANTPPSVGAGNLNPSPAVVLAQMQGGIVANTNLGMFNVAVMPSGTNGPLGYGYGSVTISNKGVKINLTLPDDKAAIVGLTTDCLSDGTIPVFAPLYGTNGFLSGWLTATDQQMQSSLAWHKAPGASKVFFKSGFDLWAELQGGIYTPETNLTQWGQTELMVDGQAVQSGYVDYAHSTYVKGALTIQTFNGQLSTAPWIIATATGSARLSVGAVSGTGILVTPPALNQGVFGFTTNIVNGVGIIHSVHSGPAPAAP